MHPTTNASRDEIEKEEPEKQEPCSAYDVSVRTLDDLPVLLPTKFDWQLTTIL